MAAILPFLPAIASGVAAIGGAILGNRANASQARKQMEFQERMSGSAAQRSVRDYGLAGLNPALAYDRPASSPPGAMAGQTDVMSAGINSARTTALAKQQMELAARQQNNADRETNSRIGVNNADFDVKTQTANVLEQQRQAAVRDNTLNTILLPHTERQKVAEALTAEYVRDLRKQDARLRGLEVPAALNASEFAKKMGIYQQAIPFATSNAASASSVFSNLLRIPR